MGARVVAVGEILWDMLPGGRHVLGGAPCNVACHALALGADANLITRVGSDALGTAIIHELHERGLSTATVSIDPRAPTGTVDVHIDAAGHANYTIQTDVAWDHLQATDSSLALARSADAICFGSLAQRGGISRKAIRELVAAAPRGAMRMFDVNLRPPFVDLDVLAASFALADACKVNEQELPLIASMFGCAANGDSRQQVSALADKFGLNLVVLTRGAHGSLLWAEGEWSDHPGIHLRVRDTIGAGDSFTAAVVVGRLAKWPLDEVHRRAAEVAGYVCTQPGATPALPDAIRQQFELTVA